MFMSVIIAVALAIGGIYLLNPLYDASALVLSGPPGADLLTREPPTITPFTENARIDGEVEILQSDFLLAKVIEDGDLMNDADFARNGQFFAKLKTLISGDKMVASRGIDLSEALKRLRSAVTVERRGMTYLIKIAARSPDPMKAANLANLIANAYIDNQIARKIDIIATSQQAIARVLDESRSSVVAAEAAVSALQTNSGDLASSSENLASRFAEDRSIEEASRTADLARSQYQNLLEKSSQLRLEAKVQLAEARVVSPAMPQTKPVFPNPVMFILAGLVLGLAVGAALARVRHRELFFERVSVN